METCETNLKDLKIGEETKWENFNSDIKYTYIVKILSEKEYSEELENHNVKESSRNCTRCGGEFYSKEDPDDNYWMSKYSFLCKDKNCSTLYKYLSERF